MALCISFQSNVAGPLIGWRPQFNSFVANTAEFQWANITPMRVRLSPGNTLVGDTVPAGRFIHRITGPTDNIRPINFQDPPAWVSTIQEDPVNTNSLQQLGSYVTAEVDPWIVNFTTPPVIVPNVGYDTDADEQLASPFWSPDKGWIDNDLDAINYGPGVIMSHDLDSEQQKQQLGFYFDPDQSDYNEEFLNQIPFNPVLVNQPGEVDHQLSLPWFSFFDDPSNYTFPPIVKATSPVFVQVNTVGGTTNTTVVVQIAPQSGNILVIVIDTLPVTATIVSVVDNIGQSQYQFKSTSTTTGVRESLYWGFVIGSPTQVTVTLAGSPTSSTILVAEYAGVAAEGITSSSATGLVTSFSSAAQQLADDNNILLVGAVIAFATTNPVSSAGAVLRQQFTNTTSGHRIALADETALNHASSTIGMSWSSPQRSGFTTLELRGVSPEGTIDLDAENQKQHSPFYFDPDQSDYGVELVQPSVPFTAINDWTLDSENQIQQPSYVFDGELLDTGVELVQAVQVQFNDWSQESDALYQPSYTPDKDVSDNLVELITLPSLVADDGLDQENSKQQDSYQLDRDNQENIQFFFIPTLELDTDSDIQFPSPIWAKTHLLDEAVELVQIAFNFNNDWSTDAENQNYQIPWTQEKDLSDTGTERIQLPPNVWDTDSDNQSQSPSYIIDKYNSDDSIELIILSQGVLSGWDQDVERQIPMPTTFSYDSQEERELSNFVIVPNYVEPDEQHYVFPVWAKVEIEEQDRAILLQYGAGVIEGWDWNYGQELYNPSWYIDVWEERDVSPGTVPANIVYVMVIYNIIAKPVIKLTLQNTPRVIMSDISSSLIAKISGIQTTPQIDVHDIQTTPRITFGDSDGVFRDNFSLRSGPLGPAYMAGSGPFQFNTEGLYYSTNSTYGVLDGPVQTDQFAEIEVLDLDQTLHNNDSATILLRFTGTPLGVFTSDSFYYSAIVSANNPNLFIVKVSPTDAAIIAQIDPFPLPTRFKFRFEVIGSVLNVYINDVLVLSTVDSELTFGRTGLYISGTPPNGAGIISFKSSTAFPPSSGGIQVVRH